MSYVVLELVDVGQTDRGAGGSLFGALQVPRPPNPGYSSMEINLTSFSIHATSFPGSLI